MIGLVAWFLLGVIVTAPGVSLAAQRNPFLRTIDIEEAFSLDSAPTLTSEQEARDSLKAYLNSIGGEVQTLESAFGTIDADGTYSKGSFAALKLKPSDKKRLIKLANGSPSDREEKSIAYDANLMALLTQLTAPKELGGGGLDHLRVGDLLRFRRDPKSRETEGTDNISQHRFGKAADILEINKTHCTESSLFGGSDDLPPFPVKVIWQGGAPYNPSAAILSTFDATARANALRDIIGTLPSDGYEGGNQKLEDLLGSLQRRVVADELGLDRSSLDYLINDNFLLTLGQAVLNDSLGFPTGALNGQSSEEITRSLPQGYFEDSLRLPPGSFRGDTVQAALERLGRVKVALDAGVSVEDVVAGKVDGLKNSVFLSFYDQAEAAFGFPSGALDGVKNNQAPAFAAVGAKLIGQRLRYSDSELSSLVDQAKGGEVKQLSLARSGDLSKLPLNVLPMIAPRVGSSKKEGEIALGKLILNQNSDTTLASLPDFVSDVLKAKLGGIDDASSREAISNRLLDSGRLTTAATLVGARSMETVFDLPAGALTETLAQTSTPTLEQFYPVLGKKVAEEEGASGSFSSIGKNYVQTTLRETFNDFYHTSSVGVGKLTDDDVFLIISGQTSPANTRAGASWVEEDLGLAPDSFGTLFATVPTQDRLLSAGLSVVAGEVFDAFGISREKIGSGETAVTAVGQAKIETALGLVAGSFNGALKDFKQTNGARFDTIFAKPDTADVIAGLDPGSMQKILGGTLSFDTASNQLGLKMITALATDNLENKLGWDSRFIVNGNELLAGLRGERFGSGPDAKTPDSHQLLRLIGGYNIDFNFGWDPGTTERWLVGGASDQNNFFITQGAKGFAQTLGLDLKTPGDLLRVYKEGPGARSGSSGGGLVGRSESSTASELVTEAFKKRLSISGEQAPARDIRSIVTGDLPVVSYALIAANQAKKIKQPFDNAYQMYRILIAGSGSDSAFETSLSQEGYDRYARVLRDVAQTKFDEFKDRALGRITQGILDQSGVLNFTDSPYIDSALRTVSLAYFSVKEARNDFFYGSLDAKIRQSDPFLPVDFSKNLIEGSNYDRALVLFDYIDTKVTSEVLGRLPAELQPLALAWLNGESITAGTVLAANPEFQSWMGSVFASLGGIELSAPAVGLLMQYATGTLDVAVLTNNPSVAFLVSPDRIAPLLDTALGFLDGEFSAYLEKSRQVQDLYQNYQDGNLDAGQAVFAADAILFDNQLAELTGSIDGALGLPGGSTQLLVQYAITGNPAYLAQFAFNLFFGSTIECPDLQLEAQKNIKLLIKEVINQGENTARLTPSQIITYEQSYLTDLATEIKKNYAVCLQTAGARCGVFARPEYAKQVHIGF